MRGDWTEAEIDAIYRARERVEIAAYELSGALDELPSLHPARQALDEVVLELSAVLADLRP